MSETGDNCIRFLRLVHANTERKECMLKLFVVLNLEIKKNKKNHENEIYSSS